jgi:hypothetical protein
MLSIEYSSKNVGWLKWIDAVEKFVGHSMDGDQKTDGYSLDLAHLAYSTGATVLSYAYHVEGRKKALLKASNS